VIGFQSKTTEGKEKEEGGPKFNEHSGTSPSSEVADFTRAPISTLKLYFSSAFRAPRPRCGVLPPFIWLSESLLDALDLYLTLTFDALALLVMFLRAGDL
jgi:hypothetical protein